VDRASGRTGSIRRAAMLAAAGALAAGSLWYGSVALETGSSLPLGRWVAWLGGTVPPIAIGVAVLGLLLVPDGRLDGPIRRKLAWLAWRMTLGFVVVQLLDDHIFDHAGMDNPLGISIPFPYQDLLSLVGLVGLAVAGVGALVTLPSRLIARRTPPR